MKHIYFLVAVCLIAGCSDKVQLNGKVTLTDGTPLGTGTVCFETDTYSARGALQSDGSYTVGSLSENDGLPEGLYRIYISGAEKELGFRNGEAITEPLIAEKFTHSPTSGLTVQVPVPGGKFDFQVEPYTKKK